MSDDESFVTRGELRTLEKTIIDRIINYETECTADRLALRMEMKNVMDYIIKVDTKMDEQMEYVKKVNTKMDEQNIVLARVDGTLKSMKKVFTGLLASPRIRTLIQGVIVAMLSAILWWLNQHTGR